MSVVIETTSGDITVDLYLQDRPRACLNFLKLCKIKYYNYNLFHTISRGFIAQTGDPTGSRKGGESVYGVLDGAAKRYFEAEKEPRIKHTKMGLISFVGNDDCMIGSQFFFTLGEDLTYLDGKHCVFGEVVEGFEVLEQINEAICDNDDRPYQDIRITHTVILDDPFPNPKRLVVPERSPSPSAERLQGGRIGADEEIDETEGKSLQEIQELQAEREAKARATILEMVGDLPDADMAPPENVLFVCKLNPVTNDDDLEIIFSRFGKIVSCEVIRDRKTNDSLQYAFVEFEDRAACEQAYFKMDNVLIDDRRIHVDFSQSVSKVKWLGKGRGVAHFNERGERTKDQNRDVGKGNYKVRNGGKRMDDDGRGDRNERGQDRRDRSDNRDKKYERVDNRDRRNDRENRDDRKYGREDRNDRRYDREDRNDKRYDREDRKDRRFDRENRNDRRFDRENRNDRRYDREDRNDRRFAREDNNDRRFVREDNRDRKYERGDNRPQDQRKTRNEEEFKYEPSVPRDRSNRRDNNEDRKLEEPREHHKKRERSRSRDNNKKSKKRAKSSSSDSSSSSSSSSDSDHKKKKSTKKRKKQKYKESSDSDSSSSSDSDNYTKKKKTKKSRRQESGSDTEVRPSKSKRHKRKR